MNITAFDKDAVLDAYARLTKAESAILHHTMHLKAQAQVAFEEGDLTQASEITRGEVRQARETLKVIRTSIERLKRAIALRHAEAQAEICHLGNKKEFDKAMRIEFHDIPQIREVGDAIGLTPRDYKNARRTLQTLRRVRATPESMDTVLTSVDPRSSARAA